MKVAGLSLMLLVAAGAAAQAPQKIDAARSAITFVSKQMNVPVEGAFKRFDGTVSFDPKKPEATRAEFEVDLASIDVGNAEAETEVKRPLWFNVERFPRARFVVTSVKADGPGKYVASGTLTIKGITRDVAAPVTLKESAGARVVEGQFSLKRLQYKVGEGHWSDLDTVADDVLVRFRFSLATPR